MRARGTNGVSISSLRRLASTAAPRPQSASAASSVSAYVHSSLRTLDAVGLPSFPVAPSSLRILECPHDFHQAMLSNIACAQRRVALASLYIGDGPREETLVDEIVKSQYANPGRQLGVVVDYYRARRGGAHRQLARLALAPAASVSLLASPAAPGPPTISSAVPERYLPNRFASVASEVCGVQHAKFAVFDDSVLITGANLSDDYFTRRQDRYLLLTGVPKLADFLTALHGVLTQHAHRLVPEAEGKAAVLSWRAASRSLSGCLSLDVRHLFSTARASFPPPSEREVARDGCWIVPMVQIGAQGLTLESDAVVALLKAAVQDREEPLPVLLSSPYLNPPDAYMEVLKRPRGAVTSMIAPPTLLSAAPSSSGFRGAGGLRGLIPHVYTALERRLAANALGASQAYRILHYTREEWTYHAKGLWLWHEALPIISLLGSTNLSERSVSRDIELSACILTTASAVRKQLQAEQVRLRRFARDAHAPKAAERPSADTPLVARVAAKLLRSFF
jgi:CDP-diacylglycerol--glycerol-3-phosphate 3-phosphatidyltransferase